MDIPFSQNLLILHINTEDVLVTDHAYRASRLLDIELLDHVIVGDNRWFSLKEHGLDFGSTLEDLLPYTLFTCDIGEAST